MATNTSPDLLIVYASRHGHSIRVALSLALAADRQGHTVQFADAAAAPNPEAFDIVALCASIQMGRHPRSIERWARQHAGVLGSKRTLFVSVSMSALAPAGTPSRAAAEQNVEAFVTRTGFRPQRVELVAGGLAYPRYGLVTRMVMKAITRKEGGPTDTSREYDFTDWPAVERLGNDFFSKPKSTSEDVATRRPERLASIAPA
jgi:menaquinone-dependent protoporphyrinogen oxidase